MSELHKVSAGSLASRGNELHGLCAGSLAKRGNELWKQKAQQREDAEASRIIAENAAYMAAKAAAEAAKTPEQKAEEARKQREWEISHAWCDSTEEHARSPAFYAAEKKRWKRLYAEWDEAKRIREGGHPKVDLSQGFPSLGAAAGAGGKK